MKIEKLKQMLNDLEEVGATDIHFYEYPNFTGQIDITENFLELNCNKNPANCLDRDKHAWIQIEVIQKE